MSGKSRNKKKSKKSKYTLSKILINIEKQKKQNKTKEDMTSSKKLQNTTLVSNNLIDKENNKDKIQLTNTNISQIIERIDYLDEIFKGGFKINTINNKYVDKIKNKLDIEKSLIKIVDVNPDGNCFFRCVSQFLFETEEKFNLIRLAIYTYAKANLDNIVEFQPTVEISNNKYIDTSIYIKNMGCNKEWSGDIEMQLASFIFGINIYIYRDFYINADNEKEYDNLFHFVMDYINENIKNEDIPFMLILHVNDNHYQLLYNN